MTNSLLILQVTNQPPPRQTLRDFLIGVLENVYTRIIAILTFIYLIIQFLAILGIIPEPYRLIRIEPYRTITILVAIGLLSIYMYYNFYIKVYKFIKLLLSQIAHLTDETEQLKKQLKQKTIPKDPSNLIDEHLGYPDVKFAIYALSKKIEQTPNFFVRDAAGRYDTRKNIIIGIDRGGAIVGGLLAKNLGLAIKTLAINYAANPPQMLPGQEPDPANIRETSIIAGRCLDNIDFDGVTNILLVDDAIRNGYSMLSAMNMLNRILTDRNRLSQIRIKEACILYQQGAHRINLPEFCVYQTNIVRIWLPWDTTRQALIPIGDEKRLFDDLYGRIQNKLIPPRVP